MKNLIQLFIPLTLSKVRAFRHTITMVTMKLMTALVDVLTSNSINLDNIETQYETENLKVKSFFLFLSFKLLINYGLCYFMLSYYY